MSIVNELQDVIRELQEAAKKSRRRHLLRGAVVGCIVAVVVTALLVHQYWPRQHITQVRVLVYVPSASAKANSITPTCAGGNLLLIGSTAFQPIAQAVADLYMTQCLNANITVMGGDSAYGVSQLLTKYGPKTTIAMFDGIDKQAKGYASTAIGVVVFSVIANGRNYLHDLNISTGDLMGIFLGNGRQGVVAVGRRNGSGTRQAFFQRVLAPKTLPNQYSFNCPAPTGHSVAFEQCTEDSTGGMLNFVNGTPNAIGYAAVFGPLAGFPEVSVININHYAPTADNVRSGKYPFWAVEHLYTDAQPEPLTSDFLKYLSSYIKSYPPQDFMPCPAGLPGGC